MTQAFTIFIAIWLLEAHRLAWGLPALVIALAGLAGLFARPHEPPQTQSSPVRPSRSCARVLASSRDTCIWEMPSSAAICD